MLNPVITRKIANERQAQPVSVVAICVGAHGVPTGALVHATVAANEEALHI